MNPTNQGGKGPFSHGYDYNRMNPQPEAPSDDFVLTLPGAEQAPSRPQTDIHGGPGHFDVPESERYDDQSAQWPNINATERSTIPVAPTMTSSIPSVQSNAAPAAPQYVMFNDQPKQEDAPAAVAAVAKRRNTVLRLFGLVAIFLGLIALTIVTLILLPRIIGFISDLSFDFNSNRGDTIVTADRPSIASGEIALLTWNGPVRTVGVYTLTVPCKDGIVATFHSGEPIACDQEFFFTSTDNTVAYRIYNTSGREQSVPAYINYKDENEDEIIIGDAVVTVANGIGAPQQPGTPVVVTPTPSQPSTPSTPSTPTTPSTPSTPPASSGQTMADLTITLTDIGWLDDNNTFRTGSAPANAKSAVKFIVRNTGTRASGAWSFSAQLPSAASPNYQSPVQASIGTNGLSEFTLGFDTAGTARPVVITVNSDRAVTERSYTNNTLVVQNYRPGSGSTGSTGSTGTPTTFGSDLQVQVLSVGRMVNGQFQSTGSAAINDVGAVQFIVRNNGSVATGAWKFSATLPAANTSNRNYTSADQASLAPGSAVTFTLSFSGFDSTGTRQISLTADSGNQVIESNESNNTQTVAISVTN